MATQSRPTCGALLMLLLLLQSTGCTTWRTRPGASAAAIIETRHPARARLDLVSGSRTELRAPVVEGDTILGLARGDTARVAAADVTAVAVRRFSPARTLLLVAGSTAALVGVACAMACGFGSIGFGY
jgi:hypothetical protein